MNGERFIEIKSEVRVVIDKRLIDELGIPEDEVRRFVENRLASLSHRFSTWITETITSSLLLSKTKNRDVKPEVNQRIIKNESKQTEDTVEVIEKNGTLYLVPNKSPTYKKYSKARKRYLLHNGKLVPLEMTSKRGIKNPEAITILREALSRHGKITLRIVEANWNQIVFAVSGEENAENKNSAL